MYNEKDGTSEGICTNITDSGGGTTPKRPIASKKSQNNLYTLDKIPVTKNS
jgi:hypothetical protein